MRFVPSCFRNSFHFLFCLAFAYFSFASLISASDFSFVTGDDLIAKESYRKVSMDFKDASLKNILKIFSEQAGLNFIASQSIQDRTVTLYLDNVPLQEALNKIMSANNLRYELESGGNVFVVKESGKPDIDIITKVFQLKHARLKGSKIESAIASGATSLFATQGSSTSATTATGASEDASNIEDAIKAVLTTNGKMVPDIRTNSLIITDIPDQFSIIERVISILDVPSPQVMIEVEMLDVSKSVIDQVGVDTSATIMELTGSSTTSKFPSFLATGTNPGPGSFTYGTLSSAAFTAILDFLKTDSKTKFLARPRILTMTNETAEIQIATNEAIGQNTVTSSAEGSATTTTEAERFLTGVSLKVTPQIDTTSQTVTMFIQPTVSVSKIGATFHDTTYKDPEVRSSQSTLMVKNGETIVVGGLIRNSDETTIKKMPVLGDIPLLGLLFRHKNKTVEERELIVFITPHIIGGIDAVAIARAPIPSASSIAVREQSGAISRREEIDNVLGRWEN